MSENITLICHEYLKLIEIMYILLLKNVTKVKNILQVL